MKTDKTLPASSHCTLRYQKCKSEVNNIYTTMICKFCEKCGGNTHNTGISHHTSFTVEIDTQKEEPEGEQIYNKGENMDLVNEENIEKAKVEYADTLPLLSIVLCHLTGFTNCFPLLGSLLVCVVGDCQCPAWYLLRTYHRTCRSIYGCCQLLICIF